MLPSEKSLRVLLAYRSDIDVQGGAASVMNGTAMGLRKLGVEVDITHDVEPALDKGYDLVHVFNVWWPPTALQQMEYLRAQQMPIVWQPIYLRLSEYAWANLGVRAVFDPKRSESEQKELLTAFKRGTLEVNGMHRWSPTNEVFADLFRYIRDMARLADHTCVCSLHEAQGLFQAAELTNAQFTVVPHGVDPGVFAGADPSVFRNQFGIDDDFVLCVAAVDGRKNQLFLAEALRGTGIKLVLVGPCYEPDYLDLVRERGGENVTYFDRLPQAMVASAVAAARLHALPSYAEGSALASMEAASAGTPIVVSNRSSEFEYYGDLAYYCDPGDPQSIREAIVEAWEARGSEPERCAALAERMIAYTWEAAGEATLQAYRRTLTGFQRRKPASFSARGRTAGVLWSAPLFDPSGYADEARNFLSGLDQINVPLRAQALTWSSRRADLNLEESAMLDRLTKARSADDYVHVQHIFPIYFQPNRNAAASVGRTMFETDRIPQNWVDRCNTMDEVWVPSDFNLETFARSGVHPSRLRKLPGALDADKFRQPVAPLPLGSNAGGFRFLSIFDWSLRKGWDVLLRGFVEEFSPDEDVCLVLKLYSSNGLTDAQLADQVRAYVRSVIGDQRAPRIVLLGGTYDELKMRRLYRAANAYVMPSRGEGWGRPLMEAMASGLPTIGTNWSGNTEFMSASNSYLIDYTLADVSTAAVAEATHFAGHRWAEPSVEHLKQLMRHVFNNRDEAQERGRQARIDVLERYNRIAVANIAAEHLERLLGRSVAPALEPLRLDNRRGTVYLHQPHWDGVEWERVLSSYAKGFGPDDDVTLVLWLDPDQGLSEADAAERIMQVLNDSGVDPRHMADLLLLPDRLDSLGLARLRASADHVIRDMRQLQSLHATAA